MANARAIESIRSRPQAIRRAARVSVPTRSAISVFDMNAFAPGRAGGGNLGIALSTYTRIIVRRSAGSQQQPTDTSEQQVLFKYCVNNWASQVGETGPFTLEVLEAPLQHVGLASSSALQTAVYSGLNWLDGLPLSEHEILELLYSSYREAAGDNIVEGLTTGLSGFLNLYGGFVALDTDLRPLRHRFLPPWHFIVAVPRKWARSTFGDDEIQLLMNDGKRLDGRDRRAKRSLIDSVILPSLERQDLRAFGRGVYELQQLGNKRCEVLLHGRRMEVALEELSHSGVECVFLSALGPAIVLISEKPLDEVARRLDQLELDTPYGGVVDNTGIVALASETP